MKTKRIGIIFLLPVILLTGCMAPSSKTPPWALLPQQSYPPAEYLFSFGQSPSYFQSRKNAKKNARSLYNMQMAEARELQRQAFTRIGIPPAYAPVFSDGASADFPPPPVIPDIHIADSYKNETGQIRTLAYIDRGEAVEPSLKSIRSLAANVRRYRDQAQTAPDAFSRYAQLRAALLYALQNEIHVARTAVLLPSALQNLNPGYTTTNLFRQTADAAAAVTFTLNIEAPKSTKERITTTLGTLGFKPADKNSTLLVSGKLTTSAVPDKDRRTATVSWKLDLTVSDNRGKQLVHLRDSQKETGPLTEADMRAARALETVLGTELRSGVLHALNRRAGISD